MQRIARRSLLPLPALLLAARAGAEEA